MAFLKNIGTVALYEAKILRRSWFFRLFSLGALGIFTIMNLGFFSPIGDEPWEFISIPSSVPLLNLYMLNIAQAIVVIFLASDFLKRDKKLDTNEVLYTRPVSNFEYITGKTFGILRLFIGFDLLILGIGLLMNIISKNMRVDILSYLYYLLIICVPTLVFSLGFAFILMSVVRNQAVTFMILLGYAALNMFWLYYRAGYVFDYMAFGLPVFKSDLIGFDNAGLIISQRLTYLFLGLASVMGTVLLFQRLPQSVVQRSLAGILLVLFLSGSVACGLKTLRVFLKDKNDRQSALEASRKFENDDFMRITDASIDLVHEGTSIRASAALKILNDNKAPAEKYIFSLNPSLLIDAVESPSGNLRYTRINHILEIYPGSRLNPDETDSLVIKYHGKVNESFCFSGYKGTPKENPYRIEMLNISKRQAFLTEDYVLLTPEAHWYPASALNFYPSNPARIKTDFTRYTLKVKTSDGLTAVSQGLMKKSDGRFIFRPEKPLTGLTLAIGNYQADSITVDSVRYLSYHFPGNDYYKKDLSELKDTLGLLISGLMRDMETNFSVRYPFSTLTFLEVPVQYYSYPRQNTQTRAEVQPSLVLLPEKLSTISNAGFKKHFQRQKRRMARNNQIITDKELQVRLFNNFVRNTFISGTNFRYVNGVAWNEPVRYRLGPSFYFYRNNFHSSEYPVINAVFESYLQRVQNPGDFSSFDDLFGGLSENDIANLVLKKYSLAEILSKNPGGDTLRTVLNLKGDYLFTLLRAKAGADEFNQWFRKYLGDNMFKSTDILSFNSDYKERFGVEFYPFLDEWFNNKVQPGFIISDFRVSEIISGDRTKYQVTFAVSNTEPATGVLNITFRTGEAGPGGSGMTGVITQLPGGGRTIMISGQGSGLEGTNISRMVFLGPGESKKIGLVLNDQPRAMIVNTLYSRNIPGEINVPVEEIIKTRGPVREFTGEETSVELPLYSDPTEIIVDNEDPGFSVSQTTGNVSPLKRWLGISTDDRLPYEQIRMYGIPEFWQPVVQTFYYGKYVRSSVYTKAGAGDRSVFWKTPLKKPGYYDVYTYIGKSGDRLLVNRGSQAEPGFIPPEPEGSDVYQDMHYRIYHDEGIEEIIVGYENSEPGWNMLGRYYISSDTAKVELTNKSTGKIVIGDAVKWVPQF